MEGDIVYTSIMCVVMLNEALTSDVPDVDLMIGRPSCYAGSVRMELNLVDSSFVLFEVPDHVFGGHIPQTD